jgi:tetratricopeptide (TPR) repeat protein
MVGNMRLCIAVLLGGLFFCGDIRAAGYTYDYDDNCRNAYKCYLALHPEEGRAYILNEIKANPYNLMATYIADYEDCTQLLMNCNKADYANRASHLAARISLLEKGSTASPWHRFCMAGIYLHWAIVSTRFGEQYKAALNFRRSYALLKENKKLFPGFEYNGIYSGLQDAVVGALPGNYKWLASVFGMSGNIKKGVGQLQQFVSTHNDSQPMYGETVLYLLFTRFYLLQEQQQVWAYMNSASFPGGKELLNTYVKVNIALDYHKADAALAALKEARLDAHYGHYPVFRYFNGVALLYRCDTACIGPFDEYLATTKSDLHIKEVWQKLAFAYYMAGDTAQAARCLMQVAHHGGTATDGDKQAQKFAEERHFPHKNLLQARMLIEGGYYDMALSMLNNTNSFAWEDIADKEEYEYRLGNIYEARDDLIKALAHYNKVMSIGIGRHEQFPARAALRIGIMYEQRGIANKAHEYFSKCLDMPYHDFQNSIDQQAKAGLQRLKDS